MQMLLQFHGLFLSRIKYIILKLKLFTRLETYLHGEEVHKEIAGFQGARRAEVLVTLSGFKSHLKLFQEGVLEKSIWRSAELLTVIGNGRGSEKLIFVMRIT